MEGDWVDFDNQTVNVKRVVPPFLGQKRLIDVFYLLEVFTLVGFDGGNAQSLDFFDLVYFGFAFKRGGVDVNSQESAVLFEAGVEALADTGGGVAGIGVILVR